MIGLLAAAMLSEIVAAKPLPRGTIITADAVTASADADLSAYVGKQLVRPAFAGRAIAPSDLADPDLVDRQSPVTVGFRRGALALTTPGRALSAGSLGEVVTVLIDGRRRPVRARVVGQGLVEVAR